MKSQTTLVKWILYIIIFLIAFVIIWKFLSVLQSEGRFQCKMAYASAGIFGAFIEKTQAMQNTLEEAGKWGAILGVATILGTAAAIGIKTFGKSILEYPEWYKTGVGIRFIFEESVGRKKYYYELFKTYLGTIKDPLKYGIRDIGYSVYDVLKKSPTFRKVLAGGIAGGVFGMEALKGLSDFMIGITSSIITYCPMQIIFDDLKKSDKDFIKDRCKIIRETLKEKVYKKFVEKYGECEKWNDNWKNIYARVLIAKLVRDTWGESLYGAYTGKPHPHYGLMLFNVKGVEVSEYSIVCFLKLIKSRKADDFFKAMYFGAKEKAEKMEDPYCKLFNINSDEIVDENSKTDKIVICYNSLKNPKESCIFKDYIILNEGNYSISFIYTGSRSILISSLFS